MYNALIEMRWMNHKINAQMHDALDNKKRGIWMYKKKTCHCTTLKMLKDGCTPTLMRERTTYQSIKDGCTIIMMRNNDMPWSINDGCAIIMMRNNDMPWSDKRWMHNKNDAQ